MNSLEASLNILFIASFYMISYLSPEKLQNTHKNINPLVYTLVSQSVYYVYITGT